MKAEKVRKFMLKKFPTNEYWDCPVPKHHWEIIQEYADSYAKDQIQKDREMVKKSFGDPEWHEKASRKMENTPIILD